MKIIKQTGTANTTYSKGRQIKYLAVHYTAGVSCKSGSASGCASWFANPAAGGSADYIIDEMDFIQYNPDPENRYCWAVGGSRYNTQGGRLYGIAKNSNCVSLEICSGNTSGKITYPNDPRYYFSDKVIERAKKAVRQLMKLYGIGPEHVIRHYDVNGKPCPGVIGWNADSGSETAWKSFHSAIGGSEEPAAGTQASDFVGSESAKAAKALELIRECDDSGILWSVTAAQWILESGYCTTDLARAANNCFGMKASLSGNTWKSVWDGKSIYTKSTAEQTPEGREYYVTADFRKYPCIEDSIKDHSLYLLGAMNGQKRRYANVEHCVGYRNTIQLIKNGGYATDVKYVDKICNIIQRFNLDQYDRECIEKRGGFAPYQVRITEPVKIKAGPKSSSCVIGSCPMGVYTIIEEQQASKHLWGQLLSGAGWIRIDQEGCERI